MFFATEGVRSSQIMTTFHATRRTASLRLGSRVIKDEATTIARENPIRFFETGSKEAHTKRDKNLILVNNLLVRGKGGSLLMEVITHFQQAETGSLEFSEHKWSIHILTSGWKVYYNPPQ